MSRDVRLLLNDIRQCCEKVERFTRGLSRSEYFANELVHDAVLHNLLLIGEAAKGLPDDVRRQMPEVNWRKVAGFRDVIVHVYFGIDDDILWEIIETRIEPLHKVLDRYLRGETLFDVELDSPPDADLP